MNRNTAGAIFLLIVAAAGIVLGNHIAWVLAASTAAVAFLLEEARAAYAQRNTEVPFSVQAVVALLSWVMAFAALVSFIFV